MRVRLKSNDDLPVSKMLGIRSMIIFVGSVLRKNSKYYPQVYLHACLYEFVNEL